MTRKRNDKRSQRTRQRARGSAARVWKWAAALVGALAVAFATAIGMGLGSHVTGRLDGATELLSYSAKPAIGECGTQLFIPGQLGSSGKLPLSAMRADWASVMRDHRGSVASPSVTDVSIQGETSRPVTLTNIEFTVTRHRPPKGGIYGKPCGGPGQGRFVVVDLDRTPVRVIATNTDPSAVVDVTQRPKKPIRFPWTVSLTDPLTLSIVAITKRCYCLWRASISWQSGGKSGVLRIDDRSHGYGVVGPDGLPGFLAGNRRWEPFKYEGGPPTGGGD